MNPASSAFQVCSTENMFLLTHGKAETACLLSFRTARDAGRLRGVREPEWNPPGARRRTRSEDARLPLNIQLRKFVDSYFLERHIRGAEVSSVELLSEKARHSNTIGLDKRMQNQRVRRRWTQSLLSCVALKCPELTGQDRLNCAISSCHNSKR